ncbi:MAG: dTDP-4-dehydrorhamnose 3,5-epimerase family protein [Alphaproteobacteria bacterium]
MTRDIATILGGNRLAQKQSAVDRDGALRQRAIDGLRFRAARPVPHEDGHLTEIAKTAWDLVDQPIVQVHSSTTLPGRVRAWGLHRQSTDRLFVAAGLVKIVCFDGRRDSPTFGLVNEFSLSPRNPGLVVIPPNLYHGWKNIGTEEANILNLPTAPYDYNLPDALDLPWDSDEARELIPYTW